MRLKATLSGAVLLGLLAWSVPSFAEVQNVKVSGDITVRGFWRSCLDLNCGTETGANPLDAHENFFMTTTGINLDADLTENVSAHVRLANERDWNIVAAISSASDVAISQSYVTFKELFYAPLTVRIGRQPIVWGRGFVLGSNLIPGMIYRANDLHASITPNEFTDFTAFDALRASLDLSGVGGLGIPLNVDAVYIKLNETTIGQADDVNLMGVNIGSHFKTWNSEAETYWLVKRDDARTAVGGVLAKDATLNTLGIRGSAKPVSGSYLYGELAWQFGHRATDPLGILRAGDRTSAWAFDLGTDYTFEKVAMKPKIGAEWIFWSGQNVDGAVAGWDPIARGYFTTALREFQGPTVFYPNAQTYFANGVVGTAGTAAATNQHQFALYGSLKPLEDLTVAPRITWFVLDKAATPATSAGTRMSKKKNYAGMEWDTQVTYNYTDDVQFGLLYGLFAPGNIYRSGSDDFAQEMISSVSVKF